MKLVSTFVSLLVLVGFVAVGAPPAGAATVPGPPTGVSATAGNTSATVTWTAPASAGDSAIVSYSVTSSPGNIKEHVAGDQRTATVTGLTNGTSYTFTVHATNDTGNSAESSPSSAVTPTSAAATVPGAPTGVGASPGNAEATVTWTAPASNGGSSITSYVATSSPGGRTATVNGSARAATVTGLTNGTAYTFTVRAVNAEGTGAASSATSSIIAGAPDAPGSPSATAGDTRATVTWSAPAANGSAITSYVVTASPGGRTATVDDDLRSATVTGLTNGTAYTFTVRAENARGRGPASAATTSIRPTAGDTVRRLAGTSRIATALALSADTWTSGEADAVVLARSDAFSDALAGAPLAVDKNGPLLLTPPTSLDDDVRDEIDRVLTSGSTVYLLGGTAALSNGIASLLESDGFDVVRLAGADRFATAVEIADDGLDNPDTQLLVTGLDFPDALAAGAAAAKVGGAVLLTNGRDLESSTRAYLADNPGTRYSIGGQAVEAYPSGTAIAGDDRYDTSARVAARFFSNATQVGVASGRVFADALPGSVHIGHRSGPMLLVGSSLSSAVRSYLEGDDDSITTAHVYGGDAAVPDSVLTAVRNAI